MNTRNRLLTLAAAFTATTTANAELITYQLEWSGQNFFNEASATGFVTLDTDLVPNPGFFAGEWESSPFSDFSITVTGARQGNGTFSNANGDFSSVIWNVGEDEFLNRDNQGDGPQFDPINLHTELMGQVGFADFNVFSAFGDLAGPGPNPEAPTGFQPFVLVLGGISPDFGLGEGNNGDIGDLIELVSMTPVPAPSSLALLGLAALTTTRRR
ncbi:MAG: PEP-CTERM sorting domain-containing protein [Phycisphaerales bacterium]